MAWTLLELMNERYDNFPYSNTHIQDPVASFWRFHLPQDPRPHGYISPAVATAMPWTARFRLDAQAKTIECLPTDDPSAAIAEVLSLARDDADDIFMHLRSTWRNETIRVLGSRQDVVVERAGLPYLGMVAVGVHLNLFTLDGNLKIWMQKRAASVRTYPGLLDNAVAGGLTSGLEPWDCVLKEAAEEASLDATLVRRHARSAGCVTHYMFLDADKALVQPLLHYVFDMEVPETTIPRPSDGEADGFVLLDAQDLKHAVQGNECKPAAAVVCIDFMIRHGLLSAATEGDVVELQTRVHRRLDVATAC